MSITATPGASADSFVDVATADTYFAARLYNDTWETATTSSKERGLKMATAILDSMNWRGLKQTSTNSLRWPRSSVYDRDGVAVDSSTIPAFLENATAELALDLLDNDTTKTSEQDQALIKSVKAGPVSVEFSVSETAQTKTIQADVLRLITYYLNGQDVRIQRA